MIRVRNQIRAPRLHANFTHLLQFDDMPATNSIPTPIPQINSYDTTAVTFLRFFHHNHHDSSRFSRHPTHYEISFLAYRFFLGFAATVWFSPDNVR
jgi:hypothetical protein